MFRGRQRELESLDKLYLEDKFQFVTIYGRRRVGKTALINEFCRRKRDDKIIYFAAVETTAKENLILLSAQIQMTLVPRNASLPYSPKVVYSSFQDALEYVFDCAISERIIFVIDEYPYLAESYRGISSILQHLIDRHHQNSKLFLILCGSSMSFMENQVMGYKSPLYGRRAAQYKILPFDYLESAEILGSYKNEDKIVLYSITGGIPEYLLRINSALPVKENVQNLFFDTSGRLFEEPSNLLKQELKIPETYDAIITAIAEGRSKINEIATRVGIETSQCSKMLNNLMDLGLVRKEVPVTEPETSKKTIYLLNDFMFVFWYRFVKPDISRITMGFGDVVCDELFTEQLESHVGFTFEECAKQYMWRALRANKSPISFKKIGRWWGNNPKERKEEEIDFIALAGENAVFCECKWRNELVGEAVLDDLIRKSKLFNQFKELRYMLFSKSGFTTSLIDKVKSDVNITLIGVDDIFTWD